MSGYPGSGYPGSQGGYPGGGYPGGGPSSAPQRGGFPGAASGGGGGYPGQAPGGYPGSAPGGYPGSPPGGYPGSAAGGYPGSAPAGYPGGRPAAPPPSSGGGYGQASVDPNIAQWFSAVDSDRSGQISASELQRALVNGNWSNFSEEACRMMIDVHDTNCSGTIDVVEFQQLFNDINRWKAVFQAYDKDRSGLIEINEMVQAFQQMGYRFTPSFVQNLLVKMDPRGRKLTLDNFIVTCVQIKRLTDAFRVRDREQRGQASLQYEDFIGLAMGVHR